MRHAVINAGNRVIHIIEAEQSVILETDDLRVISRRGTHLRKKQCPMEFRNPIL